MINFTEALPTTKTPWHCPYCNRENYEPGGKYEDSVNLVDTWLMTEEDRISLTFNCPHCRRAYFEDYELIAIGHEGKKVGVCADCGNAVDAEDGCYYPIFREKDEDGIELTIEYECSHCGETHFVEYYGLRYISHYELEEGANND